MAKYLTMSSKIPNYVYWHNNAAFKKIWWAWYGTSHKYNITTIFYISLLAKTLGTIIYAGMKVVAVQKCQDYYTDSF